MSNYNHLKIGDTVLITRKGHLDKKGVIQSFIWSPVSNDLRGLNLRYEGYLYREPYGHHNLYFHWDNFEITVLKSVEPFQGELNFEV